MSELKEVMNVMQVSGECIPSGYYKKCEVDAVLAEKDKEIAELKAQKAQAEDDAAYWEFKAHRECHNKYKRCLAMAKWCRLRSRLLGACALYEKELWALKWHKRWLGLAEHYKESK